MARRKRVPRWSKAIVYPFMAGTLYSTGARVRLPKALRSTKKK